VTTGCLALLAANLAHRVYREAAAGLTLGLIATGYAAVAGFLAVPDGPGPPNILLAAMATGVVAVLTVRLTGGCGARTYAAVSCSALIVALAAAATVVITGPPPVLGSLTTLVALVLLESSARLSIAWAGLSPRPPDGSPVDPGPDQLRCRVIRADGWLTSLVVGSGAAAAAGAACTVAGTHAGGSNRPAAVLFAAVTGAVLLLRTRSHGDFTRTLGLLVAGTATLSLAFVIAPAAPPRATWMVAGIALPVGGALWLGFVVPALALSPVVRRSVDLLEYLGLIAIVPLGCWTCGFYSATGGLPLT
jgi:type VII secretion integral membrane protein EccD